MTGKVKELLREALAAAEEQESVQHPLLMVKQLLNQGRLEDVQHNYKKNPDGSATLTINIPSKSEQAKQDAMRQVEQQAMQGKQQAPSPAAQQASQAPQAEAAPTAAPAQAPVAAAKNGVQVRVAMTDSQALRQKYPDGFLKAMGL